MAFGRFVLCVPETLRVWWMRRCRCIRGWIDVLGGLCFLRRCVTGRKTAHATGASTRLEAYSYLFLLACRVQSVVFVRVQHVLLRIENQGGVQKSKQYTQCSNGLCTVSQHRSLSLFLRFMLKLVRASLVQACYHRLSALGFKLLR